MKTRTRNSPAVADRRLARIFLASVGASALFAGLVHAQTPESPTAQAQTGSEASDRASELAPAGQKPAAPVSIVKPTRKVPRNLEFPGIQVGSFRMYPELSVAILHDDNIYAERKDETSDYVTIISPLVTLESDWTQHSLKLDAGGDFDRYEDFPQEGVRDYWLGADGSIDIADSAKLFGGARWAKDHEDRAEPDALSPFVAAEPTIYEQTALDVGTLLKFGAVSVRLGGTFDKYDYRDVPSVAGPQINMDDRDRNMHSVGVRLTVTNSRNFDVFGQYASDHRVYEETVDDFGYGRDSEGHRIALGFRLSNDRRTLISELFAGHMQQDYQDSRFPTISKPYFGADMLWRPTPRISVTGFIDRALEESTIPGVSGYLDSSYGVRAERKLTKDLTVNGRLAYTRSEFQGNERVDKIIDAGAGLRYFVSTNVYLGADYRLIDRNSNELIGQYVRNQIMASIGVTPGRSPSYTLLPEVGDATLELEEPGVFSGLYGGGFLGAGPLHTVTEGQRGGSGSDVGTMGDDGANVGLFLGFGGTNERWYIGVEAEADQSNADWFHQKAKDESRTAKVEKHGGYGIGLRLGRVLDRGQLVFVRLMGVRTEFHSYYAQNDPSAVAGAYDQSVEVSGLRAGFGVDIPASDRVFIRLDYAYTDYKSLDVPYLTTGGISNEVFANEENMARLGVGWQFGGGLVNTTVPAAAPVSGFYAGAQFGPATLESHLDGLHLEASTPPPSEFTGEFADQSWAPGAFMGYGWSLGRWYLGAELEANSSDAVWEHIRETGGGGGRDFSVEKKSDFGIGFRAGYTLQNATLMYVRVGAVRGRFNTEYNKGNNAAEFIDRSDTLSGVRAGLGSELPVGRHSFLRVEFSHTNYEEYSFVTGHAGGANADAMTFDNSENLFRLGLGFRF